MQLQEKHSDILLNCISYNLAKMLKQRNEWKWQKDENSLSVNSITMTQLNLSNKIINWKLCNNYAPIKLISKN